MTTQIEAQEENSSHYISKKPTAAMIQTIDHRIHGDIHVGFGKRLKDELDGSLQFLPVTNVIVYSPNGEIMYRAHFILINRDHMVWIVPDEDLIQADDLPES